MIDIRIYLLKDFTFIKSLNGNVNIRIWLYGHEMNIFLPHMHLSEINVMPENFLCIYWTVNTAQIIFKIIHRMKAWAEELSRTASDTAHPFYFAFIRFSLWCMKSLNTERERKKIKKCFWKDFIDFFLLGNQVNFDIFV